jgi:hypothetical protein
MDYKSYERQVDITIDRKTGDVNGDGAIDNVYLTGSKEADGIIINNIKIDIKNGKIYNIALKTDKGYNPRLFLGDFSKNNVKDILVSIESGSTGLEGYFYIYSFMDNISKKLFDFEEFNNKYQYDVTYKDNYILNIKSEFSTREFNINVGNIVSERALYDSNGKLIKPLKGRVSKIIELRPISNNNGYDIETVQRVIGYYEGDILGMIMTSLSFNGSGFVETNINLVR